MFLLQNRIRSLFKLPTLKIIMGVQEEGNQAPNIFSEINTRMRDLEEKQRQLKDRILLIGENLINDKERTSSDLQEIKKSILEMKNEISSSKDSITKILKQTQNMARKEDLLILQRQFDLFRER